MKCATREWFNCICDDFPSGVDKEANLKKEWTFARNVSHIADCFRNNFNNIRRRLYFVVCTLLLVHENEGMTVKAVIIEFKIFYFICCILQ